jgi:hypothetical protein
MYGGLFESWAKKTCGSELIDGEVVIIKGIDLLLPVHPKIIQFQNEVANHAQLLASSNPYIMDYVIKKKGIDAYNVNGACASHYLQEIEITILEVMYDYLVEHGLIINNVCVLCSDGIMIQDKYYSSNLLKNIEEAIYIKTGFKLKLSTKGMLDGFTYSHIVKNLNEG